MLKIGDKEIVDLLDKYLKDNNITKSAFLKKLGMSYSAMYYYTKGERNMPTAVKIAIYFLTGGQVQTGWRHSCTKK